MDENDTRQFVTRRDIESAAKADKPITLAARDIITDEATQRARDLNVTVSRKQEEKASISSSGTPDNINLRGIVKAAVIAELGYEPPDLETALNKVFYVEA